MDSRDVFNELCESDKTPEEIIASKGLIQISSSDELINIIDEVIAANPQSVSDFKSGKSQASDFLMGQVMKASKCKANPKLAKQLVDEALSRL